MQNRMRIGHGLVITLSFLAAGAGAPGFSQTPAPESWKTTKEFNGLDQSSLSAEQRRVLLELVRTSNCNCGCSMKIAECRVKDPRCGRSLSLAAMTARQLQEGKSAESIRAELARRMSEAPPMLDEAVKIPIDGAPSKGPADAKITLVEFSDFQCPFCAVAVTNINRLMTKHPAEIRLVFKQFPLDIHSQAEIAAEAALAAHAQGKFWPMHDKLYANFRQISQEKIYQWAQEIGLDLVRFTMDMKSRKYKTEVQKEMVEGEQAGVSGTPTLFVNGKHFNGPVETAILEQVVLAELKSPTASATSSPRSQ
ncbi:MAG TPA: thioredoxin domain-containing protein [Bryobacteraceae bacterium]|nr:thioredoxin domain-containing protein [Bryobacteraceae bacterium]